MAIPQIPNYVFLKANGKLKGQFTEKQQTVTYFFRRADWVDVTTVSHLLRMESYVTCYDDIGGNALATPLAKNSVWQTFLSVKMADRSLWHNIGGNIWIKETADIILLKKDLMVLEEGVLEGRRTFGNIMKYIKMVQLEDFVDHYPKELSGGMKQRVAIARAYAVNPSVLLMDEPFGALDAQTRTQLQTELLETWEKERKTCFFITHDVEEAIILAQKVIIMSARPGRIKDIVDINIPYPRTQETKMTPEFLELKNHIWSQVYQEYLEVRK